jgi:hypothetical protein
MASTTPAAAADCYGEITSATTSGIENARAAYKRRNSSFRGGKLSISSLDWEDGLHLKVCHNSNQDAFRDVTNSLYVD